MRRYFTRAEALITQKEISSWRDDIPLLPHLSVHELEPIPCFTGLLDAHEAPLFALNERLPIGFTHRYAS